ncbi:hypothetical protein [Streptomyces sp. PSAA01]|uniref:hypothetical protein n=1 Tax=Streptomyces sp. PSAA01 TaxID=2912762 RepID=UPI001F2902D3|nr:hypothetical protein [Streptomyces sp. PSAA01]MCG0285255.1 hypothetical protein [Streptomyces sp. PSAA01]
MAKVRADEAGHCGVERRLMAFGARPRDPGEPGRAWLEEALRASVLRHGDSHRYATAIAPRSGRRRISATSCPCPSVDDLAGRAALM